MWLMGGYRYLTGDLWVAFGGVVGRLQVAYEHLRGILISQLSPRH